MKECKECDLDVPSQTWSIIGNEDGYRITDDYKECPKCKTRYHTVCDEQNNYAETTYKEESK